MKSRLKILAKYIVHFSPKPLKNFLHKKIEGRRLAEAMERSRRCKVSKEEVEAVLDQIDFDHDIMLHTSTINLGRVAGGAKGLAKEILAHIDTTRHTLVVSALPYFGSFAEYLHDGMTFDARTAPVAMGAVNEYLGGLPEAQRSTHPTHSVIAIGKDAAAYTGSHHLDRTPFGPHSPYLRLLKNDARIVLFGATLNNITFIHAVEDALGEHYPVKKVYARRRYKIGCTTFGGEAVEVETPVHDTLTAVTRDLELFGADGLAHGYARCWPLGEGYVWEINARGLAERYVELLKDGRSIYGRCRRMDGGVSLDAADGHVTVQK